MIYYKINVLQALKDNGISTYDILQKRLISQGSLTAIRASKPISMATLDTICRLTGLQPGDVIGYKYVPSKEEDPPSVRTGG